MLAHHRSPAAPPQDSDQRHQRTAGQQEQQLQLLIAAGLVAPDARLHRAKDKQKKQKRSVGFETGISEICMSPLLSPARGSH